MVKNRPKVKGAVSMVLLHITTCDEFHFREIFEKCIEYIEITDSFQGNFELLFKNVGHFRRIFTNF